MAKKEKVLKDSTAAKEAWKKLLNHLLAQFRAGHFKNIPGSELTEYDLLLLIAEFDSE